jgi:pyridoxamine 5'-phosphate oxidase family protein
VKPVIAGGKTKREPEEVFLEREAEYLAENFLGRLATVSRFGRPHVVPVAYKFDGSSVCFGGWNMKSTLYFRNLAANSKVALVVDDVVSSHPWKARGVEVRGKAVVDESESRVTTVKILAESVRSWGLGD